ncbi:MAG TPA: hypothetical protein ENG10_03140 [Candidatus Bathyarchaeota archaeon]|nr:hypothetical protein [Candidatus Bathyarchaeota archaeon]HEX69272.1 hypothetical protein [Candidatus Bathyarchaeota archaeon]
MNSKSNASNSKALTKRAVIFGLLLGMIYTFLGIYLSYKVGLVALGGIFILGYILLQLTGSYNYKENVILTMIASACLLPAFEISDNIAALIIFRQYSNYQIVISFPLLFFIGLVGSILGIFLLMPFKDHLLSLKWPMVEPSAKMMKALGGGKEERKRAFSSMFVSVAITLTTLLGKIRTLTLPSLPSFIGFEVSPMMAGLGFFISLLGVISLLLGALYSIGVWFFLEGANPTLNLSKHIMHPWIFSLAIGIMVTTALMNIVLNRKAFADALKSFKRERKSSNFTYWVSPISMILLPLIALVGLYFILGSFQMTLEIIYVTIIGIPITFLAAFFVAMARGETGFATSFSIDIVLLMSILLFAPDLAILLIGFSFMNALEMSSNRTIQSLKLASLTEIREKDTLKAIIISIIPGALIGAGVIWFFINVLGGIGTNIFPCPSAYVTGGYVLGVREAIVHGLLPEMYDLRIILVGAVISIIFGVIQAKKKLKGFSLIPFAIGTLIPATYIFPMFLGAALDIYLKRKYRENLVTYNQERNKWTIITSGLFAGEGVVLMFFYLAYLFIPLS